MHGWSKSDTDGRQWRRVPASPANQNFSSLSESNTSQPDNEDAQNELTVQLNITSENTTELKNEISTNVDLQSQQTKASSTDSLGGPVSDPAPLILPVSCFSALPTVSAELVDQSSVTGLIMNQSSVTRGFRGSASTFADPSDEGYISALAGHREVETQEHLWE